MDAARTVLDASGWRCGNPGCRTPLTLDVHHRVPAGEGAELALCPACHGMRRCDVITAEALRTWQQVLESLQLAFGAQSADLLLLLRTLDDLAVTGEGLLPCAGLLNAGLVEIRQRVNGLVSGQGADTFKLRLSAKGRAFVDAWIAGHQLQAVAARPAS